MNAENVILLFAAALIKTAKIWSRSILHTARLPTRPMKKTLRMDVIDLQKILCFSYLFLAGPN
jgi:hypothetical protein